MTRKMKDSGIEWIGEIPEEWSVRKLNDIAETVTDYVASGSFASLNENVKYLDEPDYAMLIRTADLSENRKKPVYINKHAYEFLSNSNLFGGEIILSNIGSVGNVYLYKPMYKHSSLAPNSIMLRMNGDNRYYYYWFLNPLVNDELKKIGGNAVQLKFNKTQLRQFKVVEPNIKEQEKIANYLDKKCNKIDQTIEKEKEVIEKLKEYKKSVITEAVTKGINPDVKMKNSGIEWIGEIPKHWDIRRIKNILIFNPSYCENLKDYDIVSFIPMESIKINKIEPKVAKLIKVKNGYTYFSNNDIIMAKVTPCFENGNIAVAENLINNVGFGSSELYVFRCDRSYTRFIFYYLQNSTFKQRCISTMYGTGGLKRVSSNFVFNYKLAIPKLEEQKQIADYLDKKCSAIDKLISNKEKVIEKLKEYKKSLIYECVTGKREVK